MVGGVSGFSFRLAQAPGFSPVAGGVSRPVGGFRFAQTGLAQVLAGRKNDLVGPPLWRLAIYLQGKTTQKQPDRKSGPKNDRASPDGEGFGDLGYPVSPDRRSGDNNGLSWGGGSDNSGPGWGDGEGGGGDFGI